MNNERRGFVGTLLFSLIGLIANVYGMLTRKPDPAIAQDGLKASMKDLQLVMGGSINKQSGLAAVGLKAAGESDVDKWVRVIREYHAAGKFGELPNAYCLPLATLPHNYYAPLRPMEEPALVNPDLLGLVRLVQYGEPVFVQAALEQIVQKLADPLMTPWPVLCPNTFEARELAGHAIRAGQAPGEPLPPQPFKCERVTSPRFAMDVEEVTRFNEWSLGKMLMATAAGIAHEFNSKIEPETVRERCEIYRTPIRLYFKRDAYLAEFVAWFKHMGTYYYSDEMYAVLEERRRAGQAHPAVR